MQKHIFTSPWQKPVGFTLAELLIALAILGVIATFTIPKVLNSQQDAKKRAIFKETIAMMSQLTWEGTQDGSLRSETAADYYYNRINAIKACYDEPVTNGCWGASQSMTGGTIEDWQSAYILASGAQVGALQSGSPGNPYWFFVIDYNGEEGPNLEGDDQIVLGINYIDCAAPPFGYQGQCKAGTISPLDGNPVSQAYYESLFQN